MNKYIIHVHKEKEMRSHLIAALKNVPSPGICPYESQMVLANPQVKVLHPLLSIIRAEGP
jgi:hypothetical protein